ncbi:hypothetical protein PRZ48_000661 [Zasmidium cellare]|uniref:4-coumarate--CoA ligase n=1 Tax=Zasmidium cellare TaxID=395010 RepID=A0ABR0F0D8_ZASCE|nr:hypothetical protein PRZ48_000661 [Zasmidium cellare]
MPWKSRWSIDIPICSLPTYLFQSPTAELNDKPIIIEGERPEYFLTLKTYRDWSKRFAAGLKKAGFQPGDRLLLFSSNALFFGAVQMGTIMAGGIFTGANPTYVARELAYQIKDSGAKFLLVGETVLDTGIAAAKESNFPSSNIFVFDSGIATFEGKAKPQKGIQPWTNLLASPSEAATLKWEEFTTRDQQKDRVVVLNYSSGTTGLPKGVEISHYNYIANAAQTTALQALNPDFEEWRQRARGIAFLPMYHAYGQTFYGVNYPKLGVVLYVMRKYDFVTMLDWIQRYKITNLTLVPPIVVSLTKRKEVKDYDLSTLEGVGCGAAPLGKESIVDFESKFGQTRIFQGWGMTELTCSAVGWDPTVDHPDPSAVGELMPNLEGMVVDDEEREVGVDQRGELWVRGPNVMKGYWGKVEETRKTLSPEGWLKTGDVGFRDGKGMVHIVDRKKELIKVKGLQVAPAELEALLLDHPQVDDSAVVGVTVNGDELPRAYIVLKENSKATPKEIASWLAERVSRHKRLDGGVIPVNEIPKNPSGKILRKTLRDRAAKEVGDSAKQQSKL